MAVNHGPRSYGNIPYTLFNATPPVAFAESMWTVAAGIDASIDIIIFTLPSNGGVRITDIEYRIDGGSAVSLGVVSPGIYNIPGFDPDVEIDVELRAINAKGASDWSDLKVVTPVLFSPLSLFAAGEQGAWFEPSPTTCFTDTAGTTPAQVGQGVALMLDKSKGLVLGPELVTNGDFSGGSTGWTLGVGWSISGGTLNSVEPNNITTASNPVSFLTGKSYQVDYTITSYAGGLVRAEFQGGGVDSGVTRSAAGSYREIITATSNRVNFRFIAVGGTGFTGSIDNITVRELAGNHATQSITSARPILARVPASGRRNTITQTEDFTANWTPVRVVVSGNVAVAPNGTTTAYRITEDTANNSRSINRILGSPAPVGTYTFSIFAKADERKNVSVRVLSISGSSYWVNFNLETGQVVSDLQQGDPTNTGSSIDDVGDGWYRCSVTKNHETGGRLDAQVYIYNQDNLPSNPVYQGDGTSGIFIWGAQAELSSTATDYQRVTSTFDVTEAGQPDNFFLFNDLIDDVLNWTAPADDYSIARINAGATVTLLAGQALSGATNVLNTARTGPYIAVDRALTTAEQNNVTAYLEGKGGGL
jgi:hypothetical protein